MEVFYHMAEKKKRDERSTTWTFVLYPESAPENWRDVFAELMMQIAVSPLHDKDTNGDGTPKKPHHHVALYFDTLKTYAQALEVCLQVQGTVPQRCRSLKGTVRYFTHMDNPEKHQYPREGIESFGGFDVDAQFSPSASERYMVLDDMMEFIENNDVVEFFDLVNYARKKQKETWFPVLADSSAYFIGQYIKSARHKKGVANA